MDWGNGDGRSGTGGFAADPGVRIPFKSKWSGRIAGCTAFRLGDAWPDVALE